MNVYIKEANIVPKAEKITEYFKEIFKSERPDKKLHSLKLIAKYFNKDANILLYEFKIKLHI